MEFDKSKVYTAVNADELKVGSKVIVANDLAHLRVFVHDNVSCVLEKVLDEEITCRFVANEGEPYSLAYLVSEPEENKLEWTDLKVGDVIRTKDGKNIRMVTGIDNTEGNRHICTTYWLSDKELEEWEKVEERAS